MRLYAFALFGILAIILFSTTSHAALTVSAITPSNPTIDTGQSITLTAQGVAGTQPYSYQWYGGPTNTAWNSWNSPYEGTLIDSMETSWAVHDNPALDAAAVDNVNFVEGAGSIALTYGGAIGGGLYQEAIVKDVNINLDSAKNFYYWFYVPNQNVMVQDSDAVALLFATDSGYGNFFYCPISGDQLRNGWNRIVIDKNLCHPNSGGSPSWSNIVSIEFRVYLASSAKVTLNFDNLRYNYNGGIPQKAQVILSFDDAWESAYTKAFPIMQANSQTGVAFVPTNFIGQTCAGCADTWMNSNELTALYSAGWDISSHTVDHVDLTNSLSDSELTYQLSESKNMLDTLGFTRSSMFLAYPLFGYNPTVITSVKDNGYVFARDGLDGSTQPNLYSDDPYNMSYTIKSYTITPAVSVEAAESTIDHVVNEKGLLVLLFHQILDSNTIGSNTMADTQYLTGNFQLISNYLKTKQTAGLLQVTTFSAYYSAIDREIAGATSNTYLSTPTSNTYYNYVVSDSDSNAAYSATDLVTVNPALATPTLSPSVSALGVGQTEVYTASILGGTSPYTYNYIYTNNGVVAQSYTNVASTSNTYTFAPATSGTYTYNVIVSDSASSPVTKGSAANTIVVNSALATPTLIPSLTVLGVGQTEVYTASWASGTSPYTVNYVYTNNGVVAMSYTNVASTSNTYTFAPATSGAYTYNVMVSDSGSPRVTMSSAANTIVVNPTLNSVSWTASNTPASYNQYQTLTATISGGTTPYTYNFLVYNATGSLVANILNSDIPNTSTAFTFQQLPAWGTNTFTANIVITDSAAQQVSVTNTLTYTAQSTTTTSTTTSSTSTTTISQNNGGSSGVSSSGGSVGSGSSQLPAVLSQGQDCYSISNFTEKDAVTLPSIDGTIFHVVENFITPTSAGITINNQSMTLVPNATTEFITGDTASLTNISYIPIQHTVSVLICPTASHQGGSPVQHNSTTTTVKTTVPTTVPTTTMAPTTTVVVVQHESASAASGQSGPSGLGMPIPLAGVLIAVAIAVAIGVAYSTRRGNGNGKKGKKRDR